MDMLDRIQTKIQKRLYEFSKHAVDQTFVRNVRVREVEQAILNRSEIIEDYPDDKFGSSCLILGFTDNDRPLHILCSYPERPLLKIITVYEPDPGLWQDFRVRQS